MAYEEKTKNSLKSGRGREIRTPDILLPKQARYQTALYPDVMILALTPSPVFSRQHNTHPYPKRQRQKYNMVFH